MKARSRVLLVAVLDGVLLGAPRAASAEPEPSPAELPPAELPPVSALPAGPTAPTPAPVAPRASTPAAPEPVPYRLIPIAIGFELGWGGVWLKDGAKRRLGLGHGDFFMLGAGAVFYDLLAIYGDLGLGSFGDDRSFNQSTTAGELESTASAVFASISAGVRTPRLILHRWFALTAGADVGAATIGVTRKIENCVDCSTQDVSMHAGTYWDLRLAGGPASRGPGDWGAVRLAGLGVTYRRASSASDFSDTLIVTVGVY